MNQLEWNSAVRVQGATSHSITTTKLTILLTNDCLTDDLVDIAVQDMAIRLRASLPSHVYGNTILATLAFTRIIYAAQSKQDFEQDVPHLLKIYEDILKLKNGPSHLTGPVFLDLQGSSVGHWVTFRIDFKKCGICYGKLRKSYTN